MNAGAWVQTSTYTQMHEPTHAQTLTNTHIHKYRHACAPTSCKTAKSMWKKNLHIDSRSQVHQLQQNLLYFLNQMQFDLISNLKRLLSPWACGINPLHPVCAAVVILMHVLLQGRCLWDCNWDRFVMQYSLIRQLKLRLQCAWLHLDKWTVTERDFFFCSLVFNNTVLALHSFLPTNSYMC